MASSFHFPNGVRWLLEAKSGPITLLNILLQWDSGLWLSTKVRNLQSMTSKDLHQPLFALCGHPSAPQPLLTGSFGLIQNCSTTTETLHMLFPLPRVSFPSSLLTRILLILWDSAKMPLLPWKCYYSFIHSFSKYSLKICCVETLYKVLMIQELNMKPK